MNRLVKVSSEAWGAGVSQRVLQDGPMIEIQRMPSGVVVYVRHVSTRFNIRWKGLEQ